MHAKRVLDAKGREWTVEQRRTPWRQLVRPLALITGSRSHNRLTRPEARTAEPSPGEPRSRGWKVAAVLLAPLVVVEGIGSVLCLIVMLPLAALELVLLGIAGLCLGLARGAGLARQRVDVTCRTGHHLHSATVLLVHGRRQARQLVEELAADRCSAERAFWPAQLSAGVTIRSHRSIWQGPDKWFPRDTGPRDAVNREVRLVHLFVLVAGVCVILLVSSMLTYVFA